MKSQSYERLWPPLLKLKFGNGWLTSNCCSSCCKKINSGFQFQFQFQGFEFQFHFQFHQFQFQFQFRNSNWAAIPIPELNCPQPWKLWVCGINTTWCVAFAWSFQNWVLLPICRNTVSGSKYSTKESGDSSYDLYIKQSAWWTWISLVQNQIWLPKFWLPTLVSFL